MKITPALLDSLESVLKRAQEDWDTYYNSGHGPHDFGNPDQWRQHVRTVKGDLRRVRTFLNRASQQAGANHTTLTKKGNC